MPDVTTAAGRAELRRRTKSHRREFTTGRMSLEYDVVLALLDAADAAERRLELLRPFAALIVHDRANYGDKWPLYDAMSDSSDWPESKEVNVGHVRAAAAEVKGADHE